MEMGHTTDLTCMGSIGYTRQFIRFLNSIQLLLALMLLPGLKQTLHRFLSSFKVGKFCDLFDFTRVAFVSAWNHLTACQGCKTISQTGSPITARWSHHLGHWAPTLHTCPRIWTHLQDKELTFYAASFSKLLAFAGPKIRSRNSATESVQQDCSSSISQAWDFVSSLKLQVHTGDYKLCEFQERNRSILIYFSLKLINSGHV